MRIALLTRENAREDVAALERALLSGLPAEQVECTRWPLGADAEAEARGLADLAAQRGKFDLAHSLLGQRTLLWAPSIDLLFVATSLGARDALGRAQLERSRSRRERVFWIGSSAPAGRTLLRELPDAAGADHRVLAREYAAAYRAALALDKQQRLDGEHDARPWGEYFVLENQPGHKVKRIEVLPGQRLSYQKHAQRSEHWMIVRGEALVVLDGVEHRLRAGQTIDIPAGTAHRIGNPSAQPMSFIEVQTGPYLGEDDIVRLQDDYRR